MQQLATRHWRRRAPGRFERLVLGLLLWIIAAIAVVAGLFAVGFAAMMFGVTPKLTELLLSLVFLPIFLGVRHVWKEARYHLLPTQLDFYLAARGHRSD